MQPIHRHFHALNQDQLCQLATQMAPQLCAGDTILLNGQIGAGKSVFARQLISTLCPDEIEIPSPTFTLIQTYDAPGFALHHCDLYRLSAPEHCHELGLQEAFENDVCVIEWPEIMGPMTPCEAVHISFTVSDDTRRDIDIQSENARWAKMLGGLNVTP